MPESLYELASEAATHMIRYDEESLWRWTPESLGVEIFLSDEFFYDSDFDTPQVALASIAMNEIGIRALVEKISKEATVFTGRKICIVWESPYGPYKHIKNDGQSYEDAHRAIAQSYLADKKEQDKEDEKALNSKPAAGGKLFKPAKRKEMVELVSGNVRAHLYPDDRIQLEVGDSMDEIWLESIDDAADAINCLNGALGKVAVSGSATKVKVEGGDSLGDEILDSLKKRYAEEFMRGYVSNPWKQGGAQSQSDTDD